MNEKQAFRFVKERAASSEKPQLLRCLVDKGRERYFLTTYRPTDDPLPTDPPWDYWIVVPDGSIACASR